MTGKQESQKENKDNDDKSAYKVDKKIKMMKMQLIIIVSKKFCESNYNKRIR